VSLALPLFGCDIRCELQEKERGDQGKAGTKYEEEKGGLTCCHSVVSLVPSLSALSHGVAR
jgi:hypothetical protein